MHNKWDLQQCILFFHRQNLKKENINKVNQIDFWTAWPLIYLSKKMVEKE